MQFYAALLVSPCPAENTMQCITTSKTFRPDVSVLDGKGYRD